MYPLTQQSSIHKGETFSLRLIVESFLVNLTLFDFLHGFIIYYLIPDHIYDCIKCQIVYIMQWQAGFDPQAGVFVLIREIKAEERKVCSLWSPLFMAQ